MLIQLIIHCTFLEISSISCVYYYGISFLLIGNGTMKSFNDLFTRRENVSSEVHRHSSLTTYEEIVTYNREIYNEGMQ